MSANSFDFDSPFFQTDIILQLKVALLNLRHYEKATKYKKKQKTSLTCFDIYSVTSKQMGDYFKIFWLFQKT